MPEHLLYTKKDGIAYVTFNRPEAMNAISPEIMVRLSQTWQDFNNDDSMRVAILTGAGDKAFCAGADLVRLVPLSSGARVPEDEWDRAFMKTFTQDKVKPADFVFMRKYKVYKPIIAAVNGFCLAGGTEIILGCDIRIAAEHVTIAWPEVKHALMPAAGSLVRLPRQIPFCKAMELMMVGDPITAQEAYRIGLINYVVPKDKLMATAEQLACKIADNGPLAVRKIKETAMRALSLSTDEGYTLEDQNFDIVLHSEDGKEGPRAFKEKRKPRYIGR